jgi:hypothetical protein
MPDVTCSVDGCGSRPTCKGFCNPHYQRFYRHGDPLGGKRPNGQYVRATPANFWHRVDRAGPAVPGRPEMGPCWLWTGRIDIGGYGVFGGKDRKPGRAHRWSWEQDKGIPLHPDAEIDHLCHTLNLTCPGGRCAHRSCVNPDHLEPVSHHENALRSVRARTGKCQFGHDLVIVGYRSGNPKRECSTCRADRARRARVARNQFA